jgi:hypothetical protein
MHLVEDTPNKITARDSEPPVNGGDTTCHRYDEQVALCLEPLDGLEVDFSNCSRSLMAISVERERERDD